MLLALVGLLGIASTGLILSGTKTLQEIYYYGIQDHAYSAYDKEADVLSILDGTIKELKIVHFILVAYTGGTVDAFGALVNLRRDDVLNYRTENSDKGFRDPFGTGAYSSNTVGAFTAPHELSSDLMPLSGVINHVSFYKARISMIVKKNEEFHIQNLLTTLDYGAHTAGASTCTWEIKMVVAPFVFWFDKAKGLGLRFTWLAQIESTTETASVEFPCSGYLTNMSVLVTISDGAQDAPSHMIWSTQDTNLVTHLVTAGGAGSIRGSNHNAVAFTNHRSQDLDSSIYKWNFQHFGSKYIRIVNRAMLNFVYISEGADEQFVWFTGDFIPFKGAHWKQVYVHIGSELATGADWDDALMFGVDLKNCQVAITAQVATGEGGIIIIKLMNTDDEFDGGDFATGTKGDIQDNDSFNTSGLYSAQNLGAIVPFSASVGSQSTVLNLGNVTAGQVLTWDLVADGFTDNSKLYFVITGQVNSEYYSKSNKFVYSPATFDYASEPAMRNF